MRQQVAQCDGAGGGAKSGSARSVEPLQDLRRFQLGEDFSDWLLQVELATLYLLHGRRGRDGFRHRRDPEDRVRGHFRGLRHIALAVCALIDRPVVGCRHCDHACQFRWADCLLKNTVEQRRIGSSLCAGPVHRASDDSKRSTLHQGASADVNHGAFPLFAFYWNGA